MYQLNNVELWNSQEQLFAVPYVMETNNDFMNTIKCTIWKIRNGLYRITVNDIRYRKLDTACITDIDTLFESMEGIKGIIAKERNVNVVFETLVKE